MSAERIRQSVWAMAFATMAWAPWAQAHCDTLDGPVVTAARQALDKGSVTPVLAWVQKADEADIRAAFDKTLAVRKLGPQARDLADRYFFETLVRVHRAGEGAPYTGLKPAGQPEPALAAADRSIAAGKPDEVAALLSRRTHDGLHRHFEQVMKLRKYAPDDVAAGRSYVHAYVEYVHYVEGLHAAAQPPAAKAGKPPAHAH